MSFRSFLRYLGRMVGNERTPSRKRAAARRPMRRLEVENLEDRTLMSVIPPPILSNNKTLAGGFNPMVVVDPVTPQKLVTVYTTGTAVSPLSGRIGLLYSNDAGQTWNNLGAVPGNLTDPQSPANAPFVYTTVSNPTVAMDRFHNVYVAFLERDLAFNSGAVVVNKFDFSGAQPTLVDLDPNGNFGAGNTSNVLYRWLNEDPALNPYIAIDNNVPTFTDPETNQVQTDTMVGKGVYVAWNTDAVIPAGQTTASFNQNAILVAASSDGGLTFSSPQIVNDAGYAGGVAARVVSPQMYFTQGTADGNIAGGQLAFFFNRLATNQIGMETSQPDGGDAATPAVIARAFRHTGGPVDDAVGGNNGDVPGVSTFTQTVNITDPDFDVLSDLDVTVALTHPHMNQVSIELISPSNDVVTLVINRTDNTGTDIGNPPRGLPDAANLGVVNGRNIGTVFDCDAPRNIADTTAATPFIAHYRPNVGSLDIFNGMTAAELSGTWRLRITDFRANGANQPPQLLSFWNLKFVSRMSNTRFGNDRTVGPAAITTVASAPRDTYGLITTASPTTGIGGWYSVAFDNTLGSFSPFQGRMY